MYEKHWKGYVTAVLMLILGILITFGGSYMFAEPDILVRDADRWIRGEYEGATRIISGPAPVVENGFLWEDDDIVEDGVAYIICYGETVILVSLEIEDGRIVGKKSDLVPEYVAMCGTKMRDVVSFHTTVERILSQDLSDEEKILRINSVITEIDW